MNQTEYILAIFLIFLATFLLITGCYRLWNSYKSPEAIRINERLKFVSDSWVDTEKASLIKKHVLSESVVIDAQMRKLPFLHKIDEMILQSGLKLTVFKLILYTFSLSMIGFIMVYVTQSILFLIFSVLLTASPFFYVMYMRNKRLYKLEQQLPDAVDLMARALRAGHAFSGALQMVSTEAPEPIAQEFRSTFEEINYGIALQDSLMHLCVRVPITDLRYFVIAVLIQRESGGNLAELLTSIGGLIRARLKLLGTIRVLSAEGKMSAWILCCLPFALGLMMNLIKPGYHEILFEDPVGRYLTGVAALSMLIGVLIMMKIVKIRI